jgi:nitronate monooxygenase
MIIDSGTQEVIYTAVVSGVPANFLRPSLESMGITQEMWDLKKKVDFGDELNSEAKAWKTIWSAGQGVTTIKDVQPVADLVMQIKREFLEALSAQSRLLTAFA